jgi:hypothetical protein
LLDKTPLYMYMTHFLNPFLIRGAFGLKILPIGYQLIHWSESVPLCIAKPYSPRPGMQLNERILSQHEQGPEFSPQQQQQKITQFCTNTGYLL